jgi:hypothetical protein
VDVSRSLQKQLKDIDSDACWRGKLVVGKYQNQYFLMFRNALMSRVATPQL